MLLNSLNICSSVLFFSQHLESVLDNCWKKKFTQPKLAHDFHTWNMEPVALEKAFEIYPDVKLVVLIHLYGTPAKIDEIKALCDKRGALIVEDTTESFGATYKGKQTGTFGDYNAISFNGNNLLFIKGEKMAKIA